MNSSSCLAWYCIVKAVGLVQQRGYIKKEKFCFEAVVFSFKFLTMIYLSKILICDLSFQTVAFHMNFQQQQKNYKLATVYYYINNNVC